MSLLIFNKEGISIEEINNPTSAGNIPSYVIRKDGRGVCEVFSIDLAIETGQNLVKERVEGRTIEIAHARRR